MVPAYDPSCPPSPSTTASTSCSSRLPFEDTDEEWDEEEEEEEEEEAAAEEERQGGKEEKGRQRRRRKRSRYGLSLVPVSVGDPLCPSESKRDSKLPVQQPGLPPPPPPPPSPTVLTATRRQALEWERWVMELQDEIQLLKGLDADRIFSTKDQPLRVKVAAHVLLLKRKLEDSYTSGLSNLHEDVTELAERAGFHYQFFSFAYMSRLGFSLVFLFFSAYLCALASMCTGYRTPHVVILDHDLNPREGVHTLPDLGHDAWAWALNSLGYEKDYVDSYGIPDCMVKWLSTITFLFIVAHPRRFLIIRRITIIFAILFLFRAFTVTVTSLPDASPICVAQFTCPKTGAYKRQPMFPDVFYRAWNFVWNPTKYVTCGDMIFSGHTTMLTMCAMIFRKYCRGKLLQTKVFFRSFHITDELCLWARYLVYLVAAVGASLIVGTRLHYTLDVAIAVYVTQRTFRYYHDSIKYPALGKKHFLSRLLRWLEAEDIIAVDQAAYELAKTKS